MILSVHSIREMAALSRLSPLQRWNYLPSTDARPSRADLLRDCRNSISLLARMKKLTEARNEMERQLRISHPSLLNGDGLWPEYESAAFARSDHPAYLILVKTFATLSRQLHGETKMENLFKWNAANLHYLVVEPDLVADHEISVGWGLLVREGNRLDLRLRPEFKEVKEITEEGRLAFLHRVAAAGTKATNCDADVDYAAMEMERSGLVPSNGINRLRNWGEVKPGAVDQRATTTDEFCANVKHSRQRRGKSVELCRCVF